MKILYSLLGIGLLIYNIYVGITANNIWNMFTAGGLLVAWIILLLFWYQDRRYK